MYYSITITYNMLNSLFDYAVRESRKRISEGPFQVVLVYSTYYCFYCCDYCVLFMLLLISAGPFYIVSVYQFLSVFLLLLVWCCIIISFTHICGTLLCRFGLSVVLVLYCCCYDFASFNLLHISEGPFLCCFGLLVCLVLLFIVAMTLYHVFRYTYNNIKGSRRYV